MQCDLHDECGHDGRPNQCEGDGSMHGHGRVHVEGGGDAWLCRSHAADAAEEWRESRKGRTIDEILGR